MTREEWANCIRKASKHEKTLDLLAGILCEQDLVAELAKHQKQANNKLRTLTIAIWVVVICVGIITLFCL